MHACVHGDVMWLQSFQQLDLLQIWFKEKREESALNITCLAFREAAFETRLHVFKKDTQKQQSYL